MLKNLKKIRKDKKGFTLIEVMIGMMVLTVAIVTTTNVLVGLIKSNKIVTSNLKAYYLAQEGIEAVRNIRDTNWMHNVDWKGEGIFDADLEAGQVYAVSMREPWNTVKDSVGDMNTLRSLYAPWNISYGAAGDPYSSNFLVSDDGAAKFYRHINVLDYEGNENFILVESVVNWKDSGKDREVRIEEVLTDWKGGAL